MTTLWRVVSHSGLALPEARRGEWRYWFKIISNQGEETSVRSRVYTSHFEAKKSMEAKYAILKDTWLDWRSLVICIEA